MNIHPEVFQPTFWTRMLRVGKTELLDVEISTVINLEWAWANLSPPCLLPSKMGWSSSQDSQASCPTESRICPEFQLPWPRDG